MQQEKLRKLYVQYCLEPTIEDRRRVLDLFADLFVKIISFHHGDQASSVQEAQAKLVLQMMLTKVLHLRQTLNGVGFRTREGSVLKDIIDPTIVASNTRNIYETAAMFHLVFVHPSTEEERLIIYNLWVIAGLSYRQRFESNITAQENREKFEHEQEEIRQRTGQIEQSSYYQQLDEQNQGKIQNRIRAKEYLIHFDNHTVHFLSWQQASAIIGMQPRLFDNMYTYFSLYAHPSNVSVFQFGDMFGRKERPFIELAGFNATYAVQLFSIFLADYIRFFPHVKTCFESLPLIEQIILDHFNRLARGESFAINRSFEALG